MCDTGLLQRCHWCPEAGMLSHRDTVTYGDRKRFEAETVKQRLPQVICKIWVPIGQNGRNPCWTGLPLGH